MLCMFGSGIAWNHGLMRPVTFVARDGLCVTAPPPVPVSGGAAGANWVAMCAAAGCLAKLVSFSSEYKDLAFGPGDGSWQLAQFGGINQYGEGFAATCSIRCYGAARRSHSATASIPAEPW